MRIPKWLLGIICGLILGVAIAYAQNPGPSLVYANGPVSGCPTLPIPNSGGLVCVGNDHVVFAPAAATKYLQLDSQSVTAAGVQKVNGVAPGPTGNVNISCPGTTPATAANFSAGASTTATVPAMVVSTTCTGTGS
jgi:hypothetical protein